MSLFGKLSPKWLIGLMLLCHSFTNIHYWLVRVLHRTLTGRESLYIAWAILTSWASFWNWLRPKVHFFNIVSNPRSSEFIVYPVFGPILYCPHSRCLILGILRCHRPTSGCYGIGDLFIWHRQSSILELAFRIALGPRSISLTKHSLMSP